MASLYVSFFSGVQNGCASSPAGSQTLTTSGTSVQSNANTNGSTVASLHSDTAHWVTIGSNPTATSSNGFYLPANVMVWVDLGPTTDKIAAITA